MAAQTRRKNQNRRDISQDLRSFPGQSIGSVMQPTTRFFPGLRISPDQAAATLANVYEPFLQLTPMLDLLYDRLVNGLTFDESAYAALRAVSWMITIVGDPLYRPFSLDQISGNSSWQAILELFERESTNPPELVLKLNRLGAVNPTALEIAGLIEAREGKNDAALETCNRAATGRFSLKASLMYLPRINFTGIIGLP